MNQNHFPQIKTFIPTPNLEHSQHQTPADVAVIQQPKALLMATQGSHLC